MNDIITPISEFVIVYIDDVLIYSKSLDPHFKHVNIFYDIIHKSRLVVSPTKIKLFQTEVRFLGHNIIQGTIKPINRSLEFSNKFPDEIKDKRQLQRFLGCLNYVHDFFKDLGIICKPLYDRLKKNPPPWDDNHTKIIKHIKEKIKYLPCLHIPNPNAKLIVDTDASDIGFGGILKQNLDNKEQLVRYYSGSWNDTQKNYSTIKKEILSIVLCIKKFEDDLYMKRFILRIDCISAKYVLEKDIKNLISKQIFARWQALLSNFDFEIEFIMRENNSLPDFLSREFLQGL